MRKVRSTQKQQALVRECPHCGASHQFDLTAVIDAIVDVMHMMSVREEVRSCSVICPVKNLPIIVDVPVTLYSGQTLINVQ